MLAQPSFDQTAPAGRLLLLLGAYAPVLAVLALRIGPSTACWLILGVSALATAWWLLILLRIVEGRGAWDLDVVSAEPLDRDVAAYVASYLLPVLAAKPEQTSGYVAYALAAALILMVAYRADLGAINPLAYLCGYRVFRVTSADGVRIVLSKHLLFKDSEWKVRDTAGLTVVGKLNETQQEDSTE